MAQRKKRSCALVAEFGGDMPQPIVRRGVYAVFQLLSSGRKDNFATECGPGNGPLICKGIPAGGGNILKKSCSAQFLLGWGAAVLASTLGIRYGLLESGFLPLDCGGAVAEGLAGWCGVKWALVQTFIHQRLGWASFACGVAAFVLRRRALAWGGWLAGVAGLVLYSFDLSAVGALLSLLVLVRPAQQGRRGEHEAGDEPADRLGVGRLA